MFTGMSLVVIGLCRRIWSSIDDDEDETIGAHLTRTLTYTWLFAAFVMTAYDVQGWL